MDSKTRGRLRYFPVRPDADVKANARYPTYFDNALSPAPSENMGSSIGKEVFCDSGGLQAFRAMETGKIVIIDPFLKTDTRDPDFFIFGTSCQCEVYAKRKSDIAALLDLPIRTDSSDGEYYSNLKESLKARDLMLEWGSLVCEGTRFAIVLQPRRPREVSHYFNFIYTPKVNTYAYPIRNFRNRPEDALGNAYVLSFLHHVGVPHVHFLGSSAPPVILLMAHAISLNLFSRASFDSLTWNQEAVARKIRYLDPETLTPKPDKGGLNPNANLRTLLIRYDGLFEKVLGPFNPPQWCLAKEWVGIYNIKVIELFKNRVLQTALSNDLRHAITHFPKYSKGQLENIIAALDLLDESKAHGHEYIDQKYGVKLDQLYKE